MKHATKDAVFLHCLPRHKEEVDDEVIHRCEPPPARYPMPRAHAAISGLGVRDGRSKGPAAPRLACGDPPEAPPDFLIGAGRIYLAFVRRCSLSHAPLG